MAFTTRNLRVLFKVYNGSVGRTYFALRQPIARISLVQATQKFCYSTNETRPKITGSLTNIQSAGGSAQEVLEQKKIDDEEKEEAEERRRSQEASRKFVKYSFTFFGLLVGFGLPYAFYEFGKPRRDENGNVIEDEFSHLPFYKQYYKRFLKEVKYFRKLVEEPCSEKLLPDPLKYPYVQPPYTLVLEMKDILIHPEWTLQTGWRFKKRPGVDQFLKDVGPPQFEIVVYTSEQGMFSYPILDLLDPNGYIMYRLFRDATHFVDGHHVKDLGALNRDLSKVIMIDWDSESVKFHPDNMLKLPRWDGNNDDTTLYDLAAFLKTILKTNVEDVREVLKYYRQFDNPLEAFRENQRKLLLQMEEEESRAQQESSKVLTSKWRPSFLRNR